jgi:hypothetical protein
MSNKRSQYHLRRTESGIDAWNVRRLVKLSASLPVATIDPTGIAELREDHWYFDDSTIPSPASIIEHIRLIQSCDLSFPIILDQRGRVMDGMHRVCRAVLEGVRQIPAVQFSVDPAPDHVNCDPSTLPYDD